MSSRGEESSEPLEIHIEAKGSSARVAPVGEIDSATAPELAAALRQVAVSGARRVVIDLHGVTFLDASELHVLAEAASDARREGVDFGVMRPSLDIWSMFVLTGLDEVLPFVEP